MKDPQAGAPLTARQAGIDRMIGALRAAAGWRASLYAFVAGLLGALAYAPFHLIPLAVVSYSALALLIDAAAARPRPLRAAFAIGWSFGFGGFLAGLYWVALSFFVQAEQFAWMAPFAMLGLPAFLALFTGAAAMLAARLWGAGPFRLFALAGALMTFEYLRGHVLTGLPWNLPGQALAGAAISAQTAAFWGVYGLSLVWILIAAAPAAFVDDGRKGLVRGLVVAGLAVAALYAIGAARLSLVNPGDRDDALVRIVQPNIPQREKIDQSLWWRNLETHIALSAAPTDPTKRLFILWPENATSVIDEVDEARAAISARLPKNALLVAGAVRRARDPSGVERYYNSVALIEEDGGERRVASFYDKHHLVPFGEYLPLQGLLRAVGLAQLAPYEDGFSAGDGPKTLRVAGTAVAPLVCYETIFPGRVHPRGDRPDWLAAVTNDAWFGDSSGPRQHLDQARLRVIETGLPMARSANTGVSALFDAAGRERARIPLYEQGVIDLPLPRAAPPTLYGRIGDVPFWVMLGLCLFVAERKRAKDGRPQPLRVP